jgi:two-component system phosphate regulon sensor histidine kinase PhoR
MKNYLESVIDNIPAVILTLDNKKRVVLHSKIREKVLKVPEDEIDNRFYKDILNDKIIEVVDNLIDALEKTGVSQYCEIDLATSIAEKPIPIGVSASYLRGAKNEVLGLLLIFRNVTLNREVSKLKHLEDVRSNFLSMISHELRTPITSVKGALSLLNSMKDENADAQTNELFDIVNRNLDRLVMLINDLLDVTEIANNSLKLNKKKSSINEIVQIAVKKLIGEAEKKCVAIEEEFGEDLPELEIDVERFEHVIMHLIHNAIKFSPKNGKVDVMTYQDNEKICISIKDSGKGIKASNLSKIYDLFFQEDSSKTRRYGGAGIGMHIVRKIVDLHNGEIIVQNNDKEPGLTVMIKLPIVLNPCIKKIN